MTTQSPELTLSCVFCKIIAGQLPADIIYQDDLVIVIKDRAPKAPIHYLIIPKEHTRSVQDFTQQDKEVAARLMLTAQKLSTFIDKAREFKLVSNNGAGAGQMVFHTHVHFLAGTSTCNV